MIIGLITSLFGLRRLILQFFEFNFKRLSFFNLCTQRPCLIKVEIDFVSFVILSETVVIILFAAHFFYCNSALRQGCDLLFKPQNQKP